MAHKVIIYNFFYITFQFKYANIALLNAYCLTGFKTYSVALHISKTYRQVKFLNA
ncbi:MAG: hypothetical protein ACJAWW_000243 [Sulfurimonas sp.]